MKGKRARYTGKKTKEKALQPDIKRGKNIKRSAESVSEST